jgi:hypothetical protein
MKRKSYLTYAIESRQGNEVTVHVNRLKKEYNVDGWTTKAKVTRQHQTKLRRTVEELEEPEILSAGPF